MRRALYPVVLAGLVASCGDILGLSPKGDEPPAGADGGGADATTGRADGTVVVPECSVGCVARFATGPHAFGGLALTGNHLYASVPEDKVLLKASRLKGSPFAQFWSPDASPVRVAAGRGRVVMTLEGNRQGVLQLDGDDAGFRLYSPTSAQALVADEAGYGWLGGASFGMVSFDAGATRMGSGVSGFRSPSLGPNDVYFLRSDADETDVVVRNPRAGAGTQVTRTGTLVHATALAADGSDLWFSDDDGLHRESTAYFLDASARATVDIPEGKSARELLVVEDMIFAVFARAEIVGFPRNATGKGVTFTAGCADPQGLVGDGQDLFWLCTQAGNGATIIETVRLR